jgi:hypothetical protein
LKKLFIMLACWFATIVAVVAGSYLYSHFQAAEYDDRALPYIRKVVPEISQWNPEITRSLMAAEALATVSEEQLGRIMGLFSRMGGLRGMETPEFQKVLSQEDSGSGMQTVIAYELAATYENGDALISINLLERDGSFEVYRFNLSSEALAGSPR